MQTISYQGLKITDQIQHKIEDDLVVEAPLQININSEPYTVVMRTPDNDIALIRGLLFAEDIYKGVTNFEATIEKAENEVPSIINITISKINLGKGYLNKRTLLSVSSCGICGKKELKDIEVTGDKLATETRLTSSIIHNMFLQMHSFQETFYEL